MSTRTFTFSVTAPATTRIAGMLSRMTSGQWSTQIADPAWRYVAQTTIDQQIGPKGQGPTVGGLPAFNGPTSNGVDLLAWTGKAHWDSVGARWYYIAGTSGGVAAVHTLVQYDTATDQFRHWQGSSENATDGIFHPYGNSHNFEMAGFDASRRRVVRLITQNAKVLGLFDVSNIGVGSVGTSLPITGMADGYWSAEVFPEVDALCVFYSGASTAIARYSLATGAALSNWTKPQTLAAPALCYLGGKVYFTGADNTSFYAKDSSGATQTLASSTVGGSFVMNNYDSNGANSASKTILVPIGTKIYAFRAGSGVHVYDTVANTWAAPVAWPVSGWTPSASWRFTAGPVGTDAIMVVGSVSETSSSGVRQAILWKP